MIKWTDGSSHVIQERFLRSGDLKSKSPSSGGSRETDLHLSMNLLSFLDHECPVNGIVKRYQEISRSISR